MKAVLSDFDRKSYPVTHSDRNRNPACGIALISAIMKLASSLFNHKRIDLQRCHLYK
jgi:hypothetical protein